MPRPLKNSDHAERQEARWWRNAVTERNEEPARKPGRATWAASRARWCVSSSGKCLGFECEREEGVLMR